ncbi:hypothetical protein LG198_09020 [Methylobacillus arboreus]|uniref:hypothetical protein n=1 Tax=Methylobacillus arboreus TaxID=755170 RepID=UPI001E630068|nr:hypothetical protein [Methylobacillus arboreus]MCB5190866.1 hypothetical protein [Methylobacillus arboreus]
MHLLTPGPLVSVVIPSSKEANFLAQAMDSVRAQGIEGLELLIDGDVKQAKGKYIVFLEADGVFEASALRARLDYLESHPETRLVHSPVKLIDVNGNDLGAVISRPKAMAFDASVNPIHLSGVMAETALLREFAFTEVEVPGWYAGWLTFAQALRTGAVSQFVANGGARHRVRQTPSLASEQQCHDAALRDVLGWIYAPSQDACTAPQYMQGLASPPFTAARRLRDFSFFIWCLVSGHANICRSMLENAGLVAFLNTWLVVSIKEEIHRQVARQYQTNLQAHPEQLEQDVKTRMLRDAIALELRDKAPSILLAVCECLGMPYPQEKVKEDRELVPVADVAVKNDPRPFVLITTFRTDADAAEVRNCAAILLENCSNPWIYQVHALLEGPAANLEAGLQDSQLTALRGFAASGKLVFSPISSRPHYQYLFGYANSLGNVTAAVVNADMVLPPQAAHDMVLGHAADGHAIYALTRWNRTATGEYLQGLQPHPPWPQWSPAGRSHFEKHCLSYDCYIFDTPISVPQELASVSIATYGCDTAIAAILRTEGHVVRNPCLSVRTLHMDEKLRDYAGERGQQDLANNIQAFAAVLLRKYTQHASYSGSLQNLQVLNKQTAWLGGPGNADVMHTIFMNLGASPWMKLGKYPPFSAITITITHGNLDNVAAELARIPEVIERNLFIIWELYGFPHGGGHIADLLVNHDRFEAIGYPLFRYQWQAMVHRDLASDTAQRILDDLSRMIAEILHV